MIAVLEGVFAVRTVRRQPAQLVWSLKAIEAITGWPWDPSAKSAKLSGGVIPANFVGPPVPILVSASAPVVPKVHHKMMLLYKSNGIEQGPSEGCGGCSALRSPGRAQANHSEE